MARRHKETRGTAALVRNVAPNSRDAVEIADRVWWVGSSLPGGELQNNVYLVEQGDESVLIDPGSALAVDETIRKVETVIDLDAVRWVICSQPDVDKVSALAPLVARGLHGATVVTHWRTLSALRRTGVNLAFRDINDQHHLLELTDRTLRFLPTPYLRATGSFATFDGATSTLFSSDLFGSFDGGDSLLLQSENSLDAIREFHEYAVPSRDVLAHALAQARSASPRMIAPQHGQLVPEPLIPAVYFVLDDLDCGVMLLTRDDPGLAFLFAANRSIHGVINTMVKEHDFSTVTAYLADLAHRTLNAQYFEIWARANDVVFRFEPADDYAGHPADPPGDVARAFDGGEVQPGRRLVLALRSPATGTIDGAMVWGFRERRIPSDATIAVLNQIISLVEVGLERELLRRSTDLELSVWHARAIHDPLTGLRNRASLADTFYQLASFDDRNPVPQMAAVMVDVDHFKAVNDTFGHAVGDVVIQRVARAIAESVRPSDSSFRLGGEEFLVLISNVDAETARRAAERIRERVAHPSVDVPVVSVSVGVACRRAGEDLESLLRRGDDALYVAKSNGRDRVEMAADDR